MKIAVSGKGGSGKTTLASLLAFAFSEQGRPVLAVDVDPSPCLGHALGFPEELLRQLAPIAAMKEFIEERTGVKPDVAGGFIRLNPTVEDIPARFSAAHRGIRLLELGAPDRGGAGCACAASTLLRQLVAHLLVREEGVVLLDMYAGVEHLGRGTTGAVDALLIVVEPSAASLRTAGQIRSLAGDLGLERVYLVANKIAGDEDRAYVEDRSQGLPVLGFLPAEPAVLAADRTRSSLRDLSPRLFGQARAIAAALAKRAGERRPLVSPAAPPGPGARELS
jgi:CO dehydrogenase maturation factor